MIWSTRYFTEAFNPNEGSILFQHSEIRLQIQWNPKILIPHQRNLVRKKFLQFIERGKKLRRIIGRIENRQFNKLRFHFL